MWVQLAILFVLIKAQLSSSQFVFPDPTWIRNRLREMASMDDLPISVMGSNFKLNSVVDDPLTGEEDSDSPETRVGITHVRSGSFHSRSGSTTPRNRQASPTHSPRLGPSRFGSFDQFSSDVHHASSFSGLKLFGFLSNQSLHKLRADKRVKKKVGTVWYQRKRVKGLLFFILLVGLFFLVNWIMLLRLQEQDDRIQEHDDNGVNSNPGFSGNVSSPRILAQACIVNSRLLSISLKEFIIIFHIRSPVSDFLHFCL